MPDLVHVAEPGLPHLDTMWFSSQIFWLIVTCAVLYFFMARYIVPRIRDVIENRATRISHDIDRAEQYQSEAEAARIAFEADLADAKKKASSMIEEAAASIKKNVVDANAKQDATLAKQFAEADAKIASAVASANEQIAPVVSDVVQTIVKTLTHKEADSKRIAALVNEKLAS